MQREAFKCLCAPAPACNVRYYVLENEMIEKREFYIDGAWVAPIAARDCEVINPSTEEACAVISLRRHRGHQRRRRRRQGSV